MVAAKKPVSSPSSHAALRSHVLTRDLGREHAFEPLEIEGTLPATLRGTLYRNGPGQFGQFGKRYAHPFEADGAVTAVRIADGRAVGGSRIHAGAGLQEERAAGKLLHSLSAPWHRRVANMFRGRRKNTANTSVVGWQNRVFALVESSPPTEISTADLSTIGETDLGVITGAFSAHPHRVESRKALYNFGVEYGRVTQLNLYELPDAGPARKLGAVPLPGPVMLHDFIATDSHLVFFVSPSRVNVPRMFTQLGTFEQLFEWKPEHGTEILCIAIDNPADVVRFTVDAFYQWHFANAYSRGSELVVEYVRYPNFDSFYEIGALGHGSTRPVLDDGTYHRAVIDLRAKTFRSEPVADRSCEFPTVRPGDEAREHAIAYVALDDLTAIGSIDPRGTIVAHELPANELASEPVVAGEHLLVLCHTLDRAFVAVYDAARIPDGPVAKLWFDHHIPLTFHGRWI